MQSMVAHVLGCTHGAVHIDTQQLLCGAAGIGARTPWHGDSHPGGTADTMACKWWADWAMREGMVVTQGRQLFADGLTRLAADLSDPRLSSIAVDVNAPLRVAVCGRRGVGRRTVAAALAAAGLEVRCAPDSGPKAATADAAVYVVAEAVKPEDPAEIVKVRSARRRPVLVVLNKADLPGRACVDGIATASRAPAAPLSGLFALAALAGRLDGELWAALGTLASAPADLRSADHFISCAHPVPRQLRERLCAALDLSGIEQLLEPARRGETVTQGRALLRRLSGIDGVVARLAALGAGVHHRRTSEAVVRLEALAVGQDFAARIDEFLNCDGTVGARMAAAAAVVQEQGTPGERALRRARRWQGHRSAPVGVIERACAADIARGSLRDWARTRGRR
ncbi:hypothetical protein [Mycolicibacter sinensis]